MKLSPRLQTIADFVEKDVKVADIGTDHAYIPVYLVENNIVEKVIASDINEGPLKNAKEYIVKKNFEEKIETRLGSGLDTLNVGEIDTAIIAGMGGLLIAEILGDSKDISKDIRAFIIQPMSSIYELRKYLYENDYTIVDEKLAKEEDRLYQILYIKHGKDILEKEIYLEVGKKLIENKDILLNEFLQKKIDKVSKILENLKNQKSENNKEKYIGFKNKYNELMEVLKLNES